MDTFYPPNPVNMYEDVYHFFSNDEASMIKYSSQWFSPKSYEQEAEKEHFQRSFTEKEEQIYECLSPKKSPECSSYFTRFIAQSNFTGSLFKTNKIYHKILSERELETIRYIAPDGIIKLSKDSAGLITKNKYSRPASPATVLGVRPIDNFIIKKVPPKLEMQSTLKQVDMEQWKKKIIIQKPLKIVKSKQLIISPVSKVNSVEEKSNVKTIEGCTVKENPKVAEIAKKGNLGAVEENGRKVQDIEQATHEVIFLDETEDSTALNVISPFHKINEGGVANKKILLRCEICQAIFDNFKNYTCHMAVHQNMFCGRCSRRCKTAQDFLEHRKKCK